MFSLLPVFRLSLFVLLLIACSPGNDKTIAAEILCPSSGNYSDPGSQEKQMEQEIARVKAIVLDEQVLNEAKRRSRYSVSAEEIRSKMSFENPQQTSAIRIRLVAENTEAAIPFLDTLCNLLLNAEIQPELMQLETERRNLQAKKAEMTARINEISLDPDSARQQKQQEDEYLLLLRQEADLAIRKAAILPRLKILSHAQPE